MLRDAANPNGREADVLARARAASPIHCVRRVSESSSGTVLVLSNKRSICDILCKENQPEFKRDDDHIREYARESLRVLAELHRDSLYPMMGKDAWVAGADRGEARGPKPVRLGPTPQVGFPPLRLRRQPPGSWRLWNGGVQRGVSSLYSTTVTPEFLSWCGVNAAIAGCAGSGSLASDAAGLKVAPVESSPWPSNARCFRCRPLPEISSSGRSVR